MGCCIQGGIRLRKNKQSGKKKLLVVLAVILAVLIIAAAACVYFVGTENIKSVYYGIKYDNEKIADMQKQSSERLKKELDKYNGIETREPTEEETKAVESGEISEEQLVDIISGGITLEEYRSNNYSLTPPEPQPAAEESEPVQAPENVPEPDNTAADAECDAAVSRIVTKMYILRSSYSGSLSSLLSQAYSEYTSGGSKSEIASKYIGMGQALEAQCDANVNALMNELTGVLTSCGRSTELVDSIYQSYASEKQYTKAYYMSMYLNN